MQVGRFLDPSASDESQERLPPQFPANFRVVARGIQSQLLQLDSESFAHLQCDFAFQISDLKSVISNSRPDGHFNLSSNRLNPCFNPSPTVTLSLVNIPS